MQYTRFSRVIVTFLLSYSWTLLLFFFFKQKTAYEMRISDWSSYVCSSDLTLPVTLTGCSEGISVAQAASGRVARPRASERAIRTMIVSLCFQNGCALASHR